MKQSGRCGYPGNFKTSLDAAADITFRLLTLREAQHHSLITVISNINEYVSISTRKSEPKMRMLQPKHSHDIKHLPKRVAGHTATQGSKKLHPFERQTSFPAAKNWLPATAR